MPNESDRGKVYNVEKVDFKITGLENADGIDNIGSVSGIAEDGFGITPTSETEVIPGLKGEQGFSVDPSTGAEGSLTLKSTSPNIDDMIELYNGQQDGSVPPFTIEITVETNESENGTNPAEAFGFSSMTVDNAMLVSYAPFETDTRAAPDYEFEFVGYGFNVESPNE